MGQKGPGQQATEGSEARMSQIIDPVEATDLRIGFNALHSQPE
jgi:hypothetical protein